MRHHIYSIVFIVAGILACSCGPARKNTKESQFPVIDQGNKIAIVAHRGYWNCKKAGFSENSIASLKAAQDAGLWGSECDVQLTADNVVIVNHNNDIEGKLIREHDFADFEKDLLPNGERRPTIDEYLDQAAKSTKTILVIEFKKQNTPVREDLLVEKTLAAMKRHGLYNPKRIAFISFSQHICEVLAKDCPQFINQYLSSNKKVDENPSKYASLGINGVDYHYDLFKNHPNWVSLAKKLGMSVNVWTVNDQPTMQEMIDLGVHAITTNEPLQVRKLLKKKEYKIKR